MTINLLCIRDPDWENMYVSDGDVNYVTVDIGGQWNDYKDFCSCLAAGDAEALDFEKHALDDVAKLDADNPVRKAIEEYFAEARQAGAP